MHEYSKYQRPFFEVVTDYGVIQGIALAWDDSGGLLFRFPVFVYGDQSAQHARQEWVPVNACTPVPETAMGWREIYIDVPFHQARDAKLTYTRKDLPYPQFCGGLGRYWLQEIHRIRGAGGDESKVRLLDGAFTGRQRPLPVHVPGYDGE